MKKLAQKICTSFKVPAVRHDAFRGQGFMVPPAPTCIKRNMFLPDDLPSRMSELKPRWMTLAYAQALQYWVEEANPLAPGKPHILAMSVCELRWHMGNTTHFMTAMFLKAWQMPYLEPWLRIPSPVPLGVHQQKTLLFHLLCPKLRVPSPVLWGCHQQTPPLNCHV